MEPKIVLNMAQCRRCRQVLISTHMHDFRQCECGSHVDGGRQYLKRGVATGTQLIELSVVLDDGKFRMVEDISDRLLDIEAGIGGW